MNLQVQPILDALKAAALPIAEKDLIVIVDTVLASVKAQAVAQPTDAVAGVVALVLGALQPAIDAELKSLLPGASA